MDGQVLQYDSQLYLLNTGRSGFPVYVVTRTLPNTSPAGCPARNGRSSILVVWSVCVTTNEHRDFLKSNGRVKVLSGCARRHIIVSGTKINTALRG